MFRKLLDQVKLAITLVLFFVVLTREEVERGQVLAQAWFNHAAHKVQGEAYILTKDEGGRHTPFFTTTVHSSTSVQLT